MGPSDCGARTGKLQRTLTEHAGDVYAVVFSPKGDLLASSGEDRTIKLWDAGTGKVVRTLEGHGDIVPRWPSRPTGKRSRA